MKTFAIINGKSLYVIERETKEEAIIFAQNNSDHSLNIVVREIYPTIKQEEKTHQIIVSLDVTTKKSIQETLERIRSSIFKGLDTAPHYIAQPKDITINYCQLR